MIAGMKITIAIVEDQEKESQALKEFILRYCKEKKVSPLVDIYDSSAKFLSEFCGQYDIVFLDIELQKNEYDGMEVAHFIRKSDDACTIVFVTNLSQYAVEGYQVKALDYIVKPVTYDSFSFRFDSIIDKHLHQDYRAILIKSKGSLYKVLVKDIYYICIINHLCYVYGTFKPDDDETHLTCYETWMQLNNAAKEIDSPRFVKCNPSYLVNIDHVSRLTKECLVIGGAELPISRNKRKDVISAYMASFGRLQ